MIPEAAGARGAAEILSDSKISLPLFTLFTPVDVQCSDFYAPSSISWKFLNIRAHKNPPHFKTWLCNFLTCKILSGSLSH